MKVSRAVIDDLLVIEPRRYFDERGRFEETFREDVFKSAGTRFAISEQSLLRSVANVIRGLTYQLEALQGRLIKVTAGAIFDVAVDIRHGSPTFGRWSALELSAENGLQLFVPGGFAHGYLVLRHDTEVLMSVDKPFMPATQYGIRWDDPDLAIAWPTSQPIVSERDINQPRLRELDETRLPLYAPVSTALKKSPSCFISYANEDVEVVQRLYKRSKEPRDCSVVCSGGHANRGIYPRFTRRGYREIRSPNRASLSSCDRKPLGRGRGRSGIREGARNRTQPHRATYFRS